jgi:hypothetical protein
MTTLVEVVKTDGGGHEAVLTLPSGCSVALAIDISHEGYIVLASSHAIQGATP